jgi:peptidoglycan/LPS O-acetylase OafA/YrhL
MKGRLVWPVFWAQVAVFVVVALVIFVPALNQQSARIAPYGFIFLMAVFFLLGAVSLFLTLKTKVTGKIKKYLLLTGACPVGLPVFAGLHNLISGLLDTEEPVFFIVATVLCPLGFLVGAVGGITLAIKNRPLVPGS